MTEPTFDGKTGSDLRDPNARMAHVRTFIVERDQATRMAHARSFMAPQIGRTMPQSTKLRMSKANRTRFDTEVSRFFDAVCARRVCSLKDLSRDLGQNHSHLTRVRDGSRTPSRRWVQQLVEKCHLTEAEKVTAFVLFGYIPPHHIVVRKVGETPAFRTDEV